MASSLNGPTATGGGSDVDGGESSTVPSRVLDALPAPRRTRTHGAASERLRGPQLPPARRRLAFLLLIFAAAVAGMAWLSDQGGPREGRLRVPDAVVLGVVEGVTEYLPVSSTGHLSVAERLLGVGASPQAQGAVDSYVVVVQGGAILAVAWLYRRRLVRLARGGIGRDPGGRRLLGTLLLAAAPAGAIGLVIGDVVQDRLLSPGPIAVAWLLGGLAIIGWSRWSKTPGSCSLEHATVRQALVVGAAQAVALWPGTSRSLVTILAGSLVGLSLTAAVELSFLLGFVTLLAATGLELATNGHEIVTVLGWMGPVIGVVVAFVSAAAAIRWLIDFLSRQDLRPFGYYRIAIGALTGLFVLTGRF